LGALILIGPFWLKTLKPVGLIIHDRIFLVIVGRSVIGGNKLLAQDGIQISFDVIFGAQVVVVVIVIAGRFLGYGFDGNNIWIIFDDDLKFKVIGKNIFGLVAEGTVFDIDVECVWVDILGIKFNNGQDRRIEVVGTYNIIFGHTLFPSFNCAAVQ
jgi:hypothetical protein